MCAELVIPINRRWLRRLASCAWIVAVLTAASDHARAADPDNCLSCHRYRGLSRVSEDGQNVHLYHVDPDYDDHNLGAHARVACTGCHAWSEVGVIPHEPVTPVNCTQMCHLEDPNEPPVRFSHERIDEMLAHSVHTEEALLRANELLGGKLDPGQSTCLLCHDQPLFRRPDETWVAHETPVQRCEVCHDEQLPINTELSYWHVHSRSRPARSHLDIARVCTLCHSNEAIQQEFGLHDAVASYAASFHGKTVLLGSEETASCLDCHVAQLQSVHLIQPKDEPRSPTHPDNVADTCRSPDCHPNTGPLISEAAVHLDLATDRGIEFLIGAVFIFLILSTFGPSVLLQALEMLQLVVGRHDPRQHEREHKAEMLMQTYRGRELLCRFTPHQRVQHWFLAITFTLLVVTGFPIKFADRAWAQWLIEQMGSLAVARQLHRWAGAALMLGFVYHILYVLITAVQAKFRTGDSWLKTAMGLPMMTNPAEIRWLLHQLGFLLFICKTRPDGDRFTLKEKFEYFGVFWGTVLLGITGMLMWENSWTASVVSGRVLTVLLVVHTFEAFLALLHVGVIHMIGVIFSPAVFPLSPAMFSGDTPVEEMAEAHAAMVERAAAELDLGAEKGGQA